MTLDLAACQTYDELIVHRRLQILGGSAGKPVHCAGPIYPDFEKQGLARHWRKQIPVDTCPPMPKAGKIQTLAEELVYGGCLTDHFGHFLAEFIHRIIPSMRAFPGLRLLFVGGAGAASRPLPAFVPWVFDYFGISDRVLVIDQPVRVRRLHVFPQQERLWGPPPSESYLAALGELQSRTGFPLAQSEQPLFVSRSGQGNGFAAEALVDEIFESAGARIYHPEQHPIAHQAETYLRHRRLLFSEGSALHALQLFGRLPVELTVLVRRTGEFGKNFLASRVSTLRYVELSSGMVAHTNAGGQFAARAAQVFIDPGKFAAFCESYFSAWPSVERERVLEGGLARLRDMECRRLEAYLEGLGPETLLSQHEALRRQIEASGHVAALRGFPGL